MIAALPMYDRPDTRAAHDRLWQEVRGRLGFGPARLNRDIGYRESWAHPDLILGQICNLPYRAHFRDRLTRLACADHRLPDTPPGYYHAVFVVRRDDAPRGLAPALLGVFAFNDPMSQSGWAAPLASVTARGLAFRDTLQTGSHLDSVQAVASGRADVASIDAVTWRMLQQWAPAAQDLVAIDRTGLSPAMTFVTAPKHDPKPIRQALADAIDALAPEDQALVQMYGTVRLPDRAYDIPLPDAP